MRYWPGWILCLLLIAGIGRLFVESEPRAATASEGPTVVTIEDVDGPAQQSLEPVPVEGPPAPTIEQRVAILESQSAHFAEADLRILDAMRGSQENQTQAIGLIGDLKDAIAKMSDLDEAIVAKLKSMRSCECPPPKLEAAKPADAKPPAPLVRQPANQPTSPVSEPEPQRRIVMDTMDTEATGIQCPPCDEMKAGTIPLAQADGYLVEIIPRSDRSVPQSTVYYGDLYVRQSGGMSFQRLKEIERALRAEWARRRR